MEPKVKRWFTHWKRSRYSKGQPCPYDPGVPDEVMFGTDNEMAMRWHDLRDGGQLVARLECFRDAFVTLASFKDVIDALVPLSDTRITPKEFCDLLLSLGFEDETEEVSPYKKAEPDLLEAAKDMLKALAEMGQVDKDVRDKLWAAAIKEEEARR